MIGEPFAVFGTNKVPDPAPVTCPTRAPAPWPPTGTTGEFFTPLEYRFFYFYRKVEGERENRIKKTKTI